jgi:hypothetical protein
MDPVDPLSFPTSSGKKLDLTLVQTMLAAVNSGVELAKMMGAGEAQHQRLEKLWKLHDKVNNMLWSELARRRQRARELEDHQRRMNESLDPSNYTPDDFGDDDIDEDDEGFGF